MDVRSTVSSRPLFGPTPVRVRATEAPTVESPEAPSSSPSDQLSLSLSPSPKTTLSSQPSTKGWRQTVSEVAARVAAPIVGGPLGVAWSAVSDVVTGQVRRSEFVHSVDLGCEQKAKEQLEVAKQRLASPDQWSTLGPGWLAADFELRDDQGIIKKGQPALGDHLKIDLPDPGPSVWVKVEQLESDANSAQVVVRPSADPTSASPSIAHLFSSETTNTFRVEREGSVLRASVVGDNEQANREAPLPARVFQGARLAGAWMGAKKPQWNSFTQKILEPPKAPEA